MHRALQIPEIVLTVCSHMAPKRSYSPKEPVDSKRADLAALARTSSRIFKEPALDELWRHQTTFAHILRCMPNDLWDDPVVRGGVSRLDIVRPIVPADWERPLCYLFRVRSFICETDDAPSKELFETLSLCPPVEHFFPNLNYLCWTWMNPSLFSSIRILLSPRITDLSIEVDLRTPLPHLSLIPTIALSCPGLTDVEISCEESPDMHPHLRTAISLFLRRSTRIEHLNISDLDQLAFEYLAMLPTLRLLSITEEFSPSLEAIDLPNTTLFPRLHEISLSPTTIDSVIIWLKALSHSPLLTFKILFINISSSTVFDRLCGAVAAHGLVFAIS
ncbi:hypothetical protein FB451DRAFT_1214121 [Mycena latifolia]|nr:hypothetical protein FB451DRAFT_1214121 [Mycena latifolia]